MSCRIEACEIAQWMARPYCERHWRLLPSEFAMTIRKLLDRKRRLGAVFTQEPELQQLLDRTDAYIATREKMGHDEARVAVYRARMAAVSGLVVTIRQLPFSELFSQLAENAGELEKDFPETYEERRIGIARDLAFLNFFIEARERLGEIISAHPQPEQPAPELVSEKGE